MAPSASKKYFSKLHKNNFPVISCTIYSGNYAIDIWEAMSIEYCELWSHLKYGLSVLEQPVLYTHGCLLTTNPFFGWRKACEKPTS